ncbi:hypothetical protein KUW00_17410 [Halomonas sp. DP5N14-9]|uniref:DUF6998 domain-containing protein n=1 Tax=Halomonas sp. DP5N14-9 TaxID=2859075 RepID=UPI001C994449|nr:hypothetical protein [Halomonas sp. DP5N14-9]MBY5942657.1 hypothetical protein [Halomonas sp. DP5N14-9]
MSNKHDITRALELIFSGISHLKGSFPSRQFTIDGRLVGDIGEVIAAMAYGIDLDVVSQHTHDGTALSGGRVQIKATFQEALTFKTIPEYYLGIKISSNGDFEEIFNGPGQYIFEHYAHRTGIGEKLLRFPNAQLKKLSARVPDDQRIPRLDD